MFKTDTKYLTRSGETAYVATVGHPWGYYLGHICASGDVYSNLVWWDRRGRAVGTKRPLAGGRLDDFNLRPVVFIAKAI